MKVEMKSRSLFLFFAGVFLLSATLTSEALAEVTIGNGFQCEGTAIFKGTKEIPYKKAKSTVQKTLEKLKDKLETASPKGKAAIKAKIQESNNAKKLLKACSSGTLSPSEVDPIFTQLASGDGTFTGNYNGTVAGFPVGGSITMQFTLDQTTFSTLLSLGGNLGSALEAEPLSFSADVGGIGFPAQFNLSDTFLGSVTLSISQNGQLTITNVDTQSSVTLNGQFSSQTITGSLSGTYKGIPFSGTFTLTRQS